MGSHLFLLLEDDGQLKLTCTEAYYPVNNTQTSQLMTVILSLEYLIIILKGPSLTSMQLAKPDRTFGTMLDLMFIIIFFVM